jgi:hypothetical protein
MRPEVGRRRSSGSIPGSPPLAHPIESAAPNNSRSFATDRTSPCSRSVSSNSAVERGRVSKRTRLLSDDLRDQSRGQVDRVEHKVVWVLRLDVSLCERRFREVLQIEGDDGLRTGSDRGSQDVPVVGVRKREPVNELLEARHHAVGDGSFHQLPRPGEGLWLQLWPLLQDVPKALVEDDLGPPRPHHAGAREPNEQIPQRRRVEHAGVVDDDKRHDLLLSSPVRASPLQPSARRGRPSAPPRPSPCRRRRPRP